MCLNVRDAMLVGGRITLTTSNDIVTAASDELAAGEYVRLAVVDTGTGMTAEVQQSIGIVWVTGQRATRPDCSGPAICAIVSCSMV